MDHGKSSKIMFMVQNHQGSIHPGKNFKIKQDENLKNYGFDKNLKTTA